jgi:Ca2+-binding EF-hand superfamily protein|tara:strand:+ start:835 stop:1098 length:264 start_codon:yes stop_codon:yes gene_type:complete
MITPEELKEAIKKSQIGIQDAEIDRIINEVDYHGNNKINYTEFIIATMDVKQFLDESNLQAIFSQFDTDGSGTITKDNIIVAMEKIG